ncbi:MAG: MATE family efflux transporter [Planctomycetes bacterium]|nr:MATE family efflux transporter [Planctomycetota bacterium]
MPAACAEPAAAPRRPASTTREVLALAVPATLSGFVQLAYHWVNLGWVGRLPDATTAAAGLSVATFGIWLVHSVAALVVAGAGSVVGRYVGAVRPAAASYVASQALRAALALGLAIGVLGGFVAPSLFERSGTSPAAAAQGTAYLRIAFAGAAASLLQLTADAVWRGHGSTRVPLLTSAVGLSLNAALDPLLMFGVGPLPRLGLPGAAVATVLASATAAAISFALLRRHGHVAGARPPDDVMRLDARTRLSGGPPRWLDLAVLRRFVRVGLPVAANGVFFVLVYLWLSHLVTEVGGDAALAGLGVGLRGEQVAFLLGSGCSMAAASLVARQLGAGRPDEAARAAWRATAVGSAGCLLWSLALFLLPELLARAFLSDAADTAAARAHAVAYWRIVAFCLVLQAWEAVLDGAFSGAGMTVPPMVVTTSLVAVRVPLARWAAVDLGHGVPGIWAVIAATAALRGVAIAAWFSRGTWKHRTV